MTHCPMCEDDENIGDSYYDPDSVRCICHTCGHQWIEQWRPESIIPPYNSEDEEDE